MFDLITRLRDFTLGLLLTVAPFVVMFYGAGGWYAGELPWYVGLPAMSLGFWMEHFGFLMIKSYGERHGESYIEFVAEKL